MIKKRIHFLIMMVQEKSKNCKYSQGVETSHYYSLQQQKKSWNQF